MKRISYWLLAIAIAILSMVFQRFTGPTYPKRLKLKVENTNYRISLPRSEDTKKDAIINFNVPDKSISGKLVFRKYPTNDEWETINFIREDENLYAYVPRQAPAGKIEYFVEFNKGELSDPISKDNTVKIRYTGSVPGYILLIHILCMIAAKLVSNVAGIMAIFKEKRYKRSIYWAIGFLTVGGLIFGPFVQFYAFGDYWTGIPFGWDLTDNKTLFAFIFWLIAVIANHKKERPALVIVASVVMVIIYAIPHSALGSELDYETGKVTTGMILNRFLY
jgi:hypothetical protein